MQSPRVYDRSDVAPLARCSLAALMPLAWLPGAVLALLGRRLCSRHGSRALRRQSAQFLRFLVTRAWHGARLVLHPMSLRVWRAHDVPRWARARAVAGAVVRPARPPPPIPVWAPPLAHCSPARAARLGHTPPYEGWPIGCSRAPSTRGFHGCPSMQRVLDPSVSPRAGQHRDSMSLTRTKLAHSGPIFRRRPPQCGRARLGMPGRQLWGSAIKGGEGVSEQSGPEVRSGDRTNRFHQARTWTKVGAAGTN